MRRLCAGKGAAALLITILIVGSSGHAAAGGPERECYDRLVEAGVAPTEALARCAAEAGGEEPGEEASDEAPVEEATDQATDQATEEKSSDQVFEPTDDTAAPDDDDGDDGVPVALAIAIGVVALGAGVLIGRFTRRPTAAAVPPPAPAAAPPPAGPPAAAAPADTDVTDRAALVASMIDLADRVGSDALRAELVEVLAAVGVERVIPPTGEPFDPTRHRAADATSTSDPALDQRVAATERPGYTDHGRLLRLPDVIVHRYEP